MTAQQDLMYGRRSGAWAAKPESDLHPPAVDPTAPTARRAPPHNQAAEAALLGAMLLTRQLGDTTPIDCAGHLTLDDFYLPAHRDIYQAIRDLHNQDQAVDVVTVADILNRRQQLDDAGGPNALIAMQAATPATSNAPRYARIISELSLLRRLIHTGADIVDIGYTQPDNPHTAVAAVIDQLLEFTERHDTAATDINTNAGPWLDLIEARWEGHAMGIPTGLYDLDKLTGGLQPGQLVIVCGRPAMGKSQLAGQIAYNIATRSTPRPVLFASIEMSTMELMDRFMANASGVDMQTLRNGKLATRDWEMVADGVAKVRDAPLHIVDSPELVPADLLTFSRHLGIDQHGVVIVDYLQLMTAIRRRDNRQVEVAELSAALKRVARALQAPVIAVSQLNRGVELRQDKRPTLADLRESGAIEQDADVVIGVYRDDYYRERQKDYRPTGVLEAIVLKQRQGATGTASLGWVPQNMRITNLAKQEI